jgi:hypothetical protein
MRRTPASVANEVPAEAHPSKPPTATLKVFVILQGGGKVAVGATRRRKLRATCEIRTHDPRFTKAVHYRCAKVA